MKCRVSIGVALSTLAFVTHAAGDSLSQRVRRLERSVAAQERKLEAVREVSATTSAQVAQILVGLNTQAQQITALAGHVGAISDDVNTLGQQAAGLTHKVAALEATVAALQLQVDAHIVSFNALLPRVQAIEDRVTALEAGPAPGGPNPPIAVDCAAGQSLTEAIAGLKPGANTITASGTCTEPVVIAGIDDLTLTASPGATIPSASVSASRNVRLVGFTIQGGTTAITIDRGSVVEIKDTTIETPATGISVVSSQVALSGNKVLRPTAAGVSLAERSTATIQGLLVLQGGQDGAPGSVGLALTGVSRARVDALAPGSLIYDFPTGVRVVENSSLSVVPGDSPAPLLKIWRNVLGVFVSASSFNVVGNVPFDNNARAIAAQDSASVSLSTGVSFVGNQPSGIALSNSASARIGSRVSFTGAGVAVDAGVSSSVLFNTQVTFSGNGKDINCDTYSVTAGVSRTNATLITCPNVQP